MADRDTYVPVDRGAGRGTTTIAWIALLLSLLALGLAWWALNRTGADLTQRIQQESREAAQSVQQGAQNTENAIDAGTDGSQSSPQTPTTNQ